MRFKSAFIFCLCLFPTCQTRTKSPGAADSLKALSTQIDSIGDLFIDRGNVMGVSIAVVRDSTTIYSNGFGYVDLTRTHLTGDDHVFDLASVSKLVGATLVMGLVEEGKLSLNDTLLELLPDFPNRHQAERITLQHLLSHTSGLADYASIIDSVYLQTGIAPRIEDYFSFFSEHDLQFRPGSQYSYSNSGFLLVAMIVERITGNSYQDEIDRVINNPSGLAFKLLKETAIKDNMSPDFQWNGDQFVVRPHWTWITGDGGLTATALDLARFASKWVDGTLISSQSFQRMTSPTMLPDGIAADYGLGVRLGTFEGERVVGHSGGEHTTKSMMVCFPDHRISIAVLVNTDNTPSDALEIFGHVALAVLNKNYPDLKSREVAHPDLNQVAGDYFYYDRYYDSSTFSFVRHEANGPLYFRQQGEEEPGARLYYLGNDSFAEESLPMSRFVFRRNKSGEVAAVNEYLNGFFFAQFRR